MSHLSEARHFYNRFGFGLTFEQFEYHQSKPFQKNTTLKKELAKPKTRDIHVDHPLQNMVQMRELSKEEKKALMKADKKSIIEFNRLWIDHMANSENQIAEKMALFWHDHFACKPKTARMAEEQINLIRSESTGSFRRLIHGIAKDPAMLLYLNNQQNRKKKPNENFARELMELFTLGIGNYTENDIKESARAFTGWGINKNGEYALRQKQHDFGQKVFFGKSGDWNGEDIIDMILEKEEAAEYVSGKIARFIIGPEIEEQDLREFSKVFYKSDYNISALLTEIEKSESFYKSINYGNDVLSPVELLVKLKRNFQVDFENDKSDIIIQKALGQVLLQPPNVAGWPQGKSWIDTSTIQTRMQLGRAILLQGELDQRSEKSFAMGEDLTEGLSQKDKKRFKANLDTEGAKKLWQGSSYEDVVLESSKWLLSSENDKLLHLIAQHPNSEYDQVQFALAIISSTPEYQLK